MQAWQTLGTLPTTIPNPKTLTQYIIPMMKMAKPNTRKKVLSMLDTMKTQEVALKLINALYEQGLINGATYAGILQKYT